jgi:hypothetical protein
MREERRLRVFDNRMLSRIFGPKRDEAAGKWSKLHTEEPNDLYSSSDIWLNKLRRMRWAEHVVRMGKRRGAYSVEVGKPLGSIPFGRSRPRWEDNIKMVHGIGGHGLD